MQCASKITYAVFVLVVVSLKSLQLQTDELFAIKNPDGCLEQKLYFDLPLGTEFSLVHLLFLVDLS